MSSVVTLYGTLLSVKQRRYIAVFHLFNKPFRQYFHAAAWASVISRLPQAWGWAVGFATPTIREIG